MNIHLAPPGNVGRRFYEDGCCWYVIEGDELWYTSTTHPKPTRAFLGWPSLMIYLECGTIIEQPADVRVPEGL